MTSAHLIDALRAEFERRDEREQQILRAGAMLANCAYNLAQRDHLLSSERRSLDESRRAWDDAVKAHRTYGTARSA